MQMIALFPLTLQRQFSFGSLETLLSSLKQKNESDTRKDCFFKVSLEQQRCEGGTRWRSRTHWDSVSKDCCHPSHSCGHKGRLRRSEELQSIQCKLMLKCFPSDIKVTHVHQTKSLSTRSATVPFALQN